jgi:hypothetical protein
MAGPENCSDLAVFKATEVDRGSVATVELATLAGADVPKVIEAVATSNGRPAIEADER